MATYLWWPPDRPTMRVRRNPQAVLYQPVLEPDTWGYDNFITPNGVATLNTLNDSVSTAADALRKAGTRGATGLGALAGFLLSAHRLRGALIGGTLGYLGGKYLVSLADKALTAASGAAPLPLPPPKAAS